MSEKILLTESEAAEQLNMSVRSFRREKIPCTVRRGRNLWHIEDIHASFPSNTSKLPRANMPIKEALALLNGSTRKVRREYNIVPPKKAEAPKDKGNPVVYFARSGDAVKIGFTRVDPIERIKAVRTGNHLGVELVATIPAGEEDHFAERELHERFAEYRIRGEWFRFEGELKRFVEEIKQ